MKKLSSAALAAVVLVALAGNAFALEIQVAPATLVLSSPGGQFTVHTDVPYSSARDVLLVIEGQIVSARTFADDCGNLVAQCGKESAKAAIGEFEGKSTIATATLTVNGVSAAETFRVIRGGK